MIRLFVADDHEIVRTGLRRLLDDVLDVIWCGEASTVDDLTAQLPHARPDVLVLDVNMPGSVRPALVTSLRRAHPSLRVIIFSMYAEDRHAVAYLRAGAGAYLAKTRPSKDLLAAARKVHAGGRYITPTLADYLFEHQIDLEKSPEELLSVRELEVVRALADGQRSTEVAAALGLSVSTVNTFVQRIKTKFGVRTVVEMVQTARDHGLLG